MPPIAQTERPHEREALRRVHVRSGAGVGLLWDRRFLLAPRRKEAAGQGGREEVPAVSAKSSWSKRARPARQQVKQHQPRYRGPKGKTCRAAKTEEGPKEQATLVSRSFRFCAVTRRPTASLPVSACGRAANAHARHRLRPRPQANGSHCGRRPAGTVTGDARFEEYIDIILNPAEAGGTVHDIADPVMPHLRDADPAGPNTALVNLSTTPASWSTTPSTAIG